MCTTLENITTFAAGVGLPSDDIPLDFSLEIPSSIVVNTPIALATARGLGEVSNTA